jgi:uncharacterized protein Yka (UPF0111/DUF47 family)
MIFNTIQNPIALFHLVKLAEIIGFVTDHAEDAGDMQRAMITE